MQNTVYAIISACVLHNITLVADEDVCEFFDDENNGNVLPNQQATHSTDGAAQRKRATIVHSIFP